MFPELPREWMRGPQWASPAAREEWEPVLRAAAAAWTELEILSVSAGARSSALLYLTPGELVQATREAASQGFEVTPLAEAGGSLRAALHRAGLRGSWLAAWSLGDDRLIGELLGFPGCCQEHFASTWARGSSDTVIVMCQVDGPPEANVMHRHLGVRLVPHLPCSGDCEASVELGRQMLEVGRSCGVDVDAILRVLSLPVTYSTLHGIAITTTPYWRVMSGSDWSADEARAERPAGPAPETPSWRDNGFSTREAMEAAHEVVARAVGPVPGRVLDLGCGDGALLARITDTGAGIERGADVVARGRRRHPRLELMAATIEEAYGDEAPPFDVVLIMPGRLLEMGAAHAERVRRCLHTKSRRVVAYAYGDQLRHHGSLRALATQAGLRVVHPVHAGPGVEAAEVIFA